MVRGQGDAQHAWVNTDYLKMGLKVVGLGKRHGGREPGWGLAGRAGFEGGLSMGCSFSGPSLGECGPFLRGLRSSDMEREGRANVPGLPADFKYGCSRAWFVVCLPVFLIKVFVPLGNTTD